MNDAATTPGGSDGQMAGPWWGVERTGEVSVVAAAYLFLTWIVSGCTSRTATPRYPHRSEGVRSDLQRGDVTQRARRGNLNPLVVRRVGTSSVSAGSSFAPSPPLLSPPSIRNYRIRAHSATTRVVG